MITTRGYKFAIGGLIVVGLLQPLLFHPFLPERVASHFNAFGEPDGWSDRSAFVALSFLLMLICGPMMLAVGYAVRHAPAGLINLPNKRWWLAPERADETRAWIFDHFLAFICATLGFIDAIMFLALLANLRDPPRVSGFWVLLILYVAWTVGWIVQMWRRFRLPSEATQDPAGAGRPSAPPG